MIIKEFSVNDVKRRFRCFLECPEEAGIKLYTIINDALKDLRVFLDNTYNIYKKQFPNLHKPSIYVYIREDCIEQINAFTDGIDIYLSAGSMVGMYTYICERLNTKTFDGKELIPETIKGSLPLQMYKYILEFIVSHELMHIWHSHKKWKSSFLRVATPLINIEEDLLSEKVLSNITDLDENNITIDNLRIESGNLVCESRKDINFIQQILEIDADCSAMCIMMANLYEEMKTIVTDSGERNNHKISSVIKYNSLLLGLKMGAAALMLGYFDSRTGAEPFEQLKELLKSNHPIPAIRYFKIKSTLIECISKLYKDDEVVSLLLSDVDAFSIDIFMHKNGDMDIRNCFWASALTQKAQEYIVQLEKGWNLIYDSLQCVANVNIADKFSPDSLLLFDEMIWFDEKGTIIAYEK